MASDQRILPTELLQKKLLLPNLVIAGAPKSGTSSLHTWIADHPNALGSTVKETCYYVDPGTHMYSPKSHISNGLEGYRRFFPKTAGTESPSVVLESTPSYIYSKLALALLPDLPTKPKFIFVLREPAAQLYSLFNYFKNNWTWIPYDTSFAQFLDEIETGRATYGGNELAENALAYAAYVDFLIRWRDRVGPDRMRVWLFDDLIADKKAFTERAAVFAGLDPEFYENYGFPTENETYEPRSIALQRLNVALRTALPRGKFYEWLRNRYRELNTTTLPGADAQSRELMGELRNRFANVNSQLAREFDLDIDCWAHG